MSLETSPIKVLFLASEADPLVKVGGLGDVAGSLPRALKDLSPDKTRGNVIDIRLVLPFHAAIRRNVSNPEFLFDLEIQATNGSIPALAYHTIVNDVDTYLLDGAPIGEDAPVYDTDPAIAGYKYVFFSLAALEFARKLGWQADVLHANDWHSALTIYALDLKKAGDPCFRDLRSILTIHNLPFMGAGSEIAFDHFGLLPSQHSLLPWWARKLPLPLGLQSADRIVAVSPTYAEQILTPEFGCGLETFLTSRQESMLGILNGIDQESWDPAKDAQLATTYDVETLEKRVSNKIALTSEFSLDADPGIPLLVMITRMDQQKGVDLAVEALYGLNEARWQAILLGTGDPKLEDACRQLERDHPRRVRAVIRFDAELSRRMYAGGDILLMPSRVEPCGLAQMMAMRYGCLPLAHATGGLQDTIIDHASGGRTGTGFLFEPATTTALTGRLLNALEAFPDRSRWAAMQRRGMRQDFSWEKSARQYVALYRELVQEDQRESQ